MYLINYSNYHLVEVGVFTGSPSSPLSYKTKKRVFLPPKEGQWFSIKTPYSSIGIVIFNNLIPNISPSHLPLNAFLVSQRQTLNPSHPLRVVDPNKHLEDLVVGSKFGGASDLESIRCTYASMSKSIESKICKTPGKLSSGPIL